MSTDERTTPARADLAAAHLEGEVEAERFSEATAMMVSVPVAPQSSRPNGEAPLTNQLLYGERFDAYELMGHWAWGQAVLDGYVGYVPRACLEMAGPETTHRVAQSMTHVYPEPALKVRPVGWLSYGARVAVTGVEGGFAALATGGHVPIQHLARLTKPAADWVAETEKMLGMPYLWGGRAVTGLDCSSLIQLAMQAAGRPCPRDSDMQAAELGQSIEADADLARGDLVFWQGHVGVMLDETRLLHANAHHMAVAIEPLDNARARILGAGEGPITHIARLDAEGRER